MAYKKFSSGVQTLREIREDGSYYVDKTLITLRLINLGKYFSFWWPQSFGKGIP